MKEILFWVLPPVAGAFIGYVTNAIAIKMLFRPLGEIRLFGLRLPFTPGILPRERHKLADSIGRMVEQELLTPEVVRERLARTEVREKMGSTLGGYTEQLLGRPLSGWVDGRSGNPAEAPNPHDLPLAEIVKDFVNSEVFNFFLEEIIRNWMGAGSSGEDEPGMDSWLKSRFRDFGSLFVSPARDMIKNGLVREFKNQAQGEMPSFKRALEGIIEKYPGITLGEFLSLGQSKKKRLDTFLTDKAVDSLDENIEGALSSVDVKTLVSDRINSLDMLRVEKIILDIMAGQLKWINFFGAILGALIGFAEVLFTFFTR